MSEMAFAVVLVVSVVLAYLLGLIHGTQAAIKDTDEVLREAERRLSK